MCPNNFLEPFEELADEDESPEIAAARRQGKPIVGAKVEKGGCLTDIDWLSAWLRGC